jgi:hypothetical protein
MYKLLNKMGPKSLTNLFTYKGEVTNYKLKPAAHESYLLSKKLLVSVSSADSSPIKHV